MSTSICLVERDDHGRFKSVTPVLVPPSRFRHQARLAAEYMLRCPKCHCLRLIAYRCMVCTNGTCGQASEPIAEPVLVLLRRLVPEASIRRLTIDQSIAVCRAASESCARAAQRRFPF